MTTPEGYKRAKTLKHDENNRRPPRPVGTPFVCQCCYRSAYDIHDRVCKRCLKDRNDLAKLEQEIAVLYPATAKLTSVQIFRRIWEQNKKLTARVKNLKATLEESKLRRNDDADDLIGRVGHR